MPKIYPNTSISGSPAPSIALESEPVALTVWRKSLVLNCGGFTVFDGKGELVFRVDNYSSSSRTEITLMDASGKPLFTIRRKLLTLTEHWKIYEGETTANPCFSVRKRVTLLPCKELAHVTPYGRGGGEERPIYSIEGSFPQRSCAVYDGLRRPVAEIRRKEVVGGVTFGGDVFRLVVQPGFDAGLAMAVVILLEQMFGATAAPIKG